MGSTDSSTDGRLSRSASMAGTTLMPASVDAMPHMTRSAGPIFSTALASTSEVAMASEPAMMRCDSASS